MCTPVGSVKCSLHKCVEKNREKICHPKTGVRKRQTLTTSTPAALHGIYRIYTLFLNIFVGTIKQRSTTAIQAIVIRVVNMTL